VSSALPSKAPVTPIIRPTPRKVEFRRGNGPKSGFRSPREDEERRLAGRQAVTDGYFFWSLLGKDGHAVDCGFSLSF
jgi:hypothetical protein